MSMAEVVMVKADGEEDPNDPNKTQVILQLQPISTGYVKLWCSINDTDVSTVNSFGESRFESLTLVLIATVQLNAIKV